MSASLEPPPKFKQNSPQPKDLAEWTILYRWFQRIWSVAGGASDIAAGLAVQAPQPAPVAPDSIISKALAFQSPAPLPVTAADLAAASAVVSPSGSSITDELNTLMAEALSRVPYPLHQLGGLVIEDTHAHRLANYLPTGYNVGQQFLETDTGLTYVVAVLAGLNVWRYESGTQRGTLAAMIALGLTLGVPDIGLQFEESDYEHVHVWGTLPTTTGWRFMAGESSGYVVESSGAPIGGVWSACDGAPKACVNGDGTTSPRSTQDTISTKAAVFTGGFAVAVNPATPPTLTTTAPLTVVATAADHAIAAPSAANGGLPAYYTVEKWIRQ